MSNLLKKCVYLGAIIVPLLSSFVAKADLLIDMAPVDEITITNTKETDAFSLKIDEPQAPVSYDGSDENLAASPSIETEGNVVVQGSVEVADSESTTRNLNGDLISYIEAEVSIQSTHDDSDHILVTTVTDDLPKFVSISKKDPQQFNKTLPFNREVLIAAKKTSVEPALIHAIISAESNYNPKAKSQKGAVGLMQIMPSTAKFYKVTDHSDPQQNITAGASLLRDLLKEFKGDIKLSLAAYNAGLPAVLKHKNKIPPYKETQRYVPKVLKTYKKLSKYI